MENEFIEEVQENILEVEEGSEENLSSDSNDLLSSESTDLVVDSSDLTNEHSEGVSSDELIDEEDVSIEKSDETFTEEEVLRIVDTILENSGSSEIVQQEEVLEIPRAFFDVAIDEYSVSEGLLLCIFLLLLIHFVHSIFKGSHWFGKL